MPYSALHAMMCCHTNESDPPLPRPSVFSWLSKSSFSWFLLFKWFTFPFRLFSFSQRRRIDPDLRIKNETKRRRDRLERETVRETPWVSSRTRGRKHPPDKKKQKERKKTKKKESYIRCSVVLCVIVTSFLSFPSFFDSIPRRYLFLRYVQDRNVKPENQPYVLMKWTIMYSDLFWDHDQLLSCWALRSTITFEGKGLTYSPLVSYVFSVLHTRSTHQYLCFFFFFHILYETTSECWQEWPCGTLCSSLSS